jgi:hypothetical protein
VDQASKLVLETIYKGLKIDEIYEFIEKKIGLYQSGDVALVPSLLISDYCQLFDLNLPSKTIKDNGNFFNVFLSLVGKNEVFYFGEGSHHDVKIAERIALESLLFNLFPQTKRLSDIHQMLFVYKKMSNRSNKM